MNFLIAIYTTTTHNSGLIASTTYLRNQYERHYISSSPPANLTAGFLMPCHSTPWRSHLQYPPSTHTPGISAWALTCEPPLGLSPANHSVYLDEADQFYSDPMLWLRRHMSRHPPRPQGLFSRPTSPVDRSRRLPVVDATTGRREWPDYLVFFQQLESVLHASLRGSGYGECWRAFNSHWHDDWRRQGDVVVWCLWPEEIQEQDRRREAEAERKGVRMLDGRSNESDSGHESTKAKVQLTVDKPFWKRRDRDGKDVAGLAKSKGNLVFWNWRRTWPFADGSSNRRKKTKEKDRKSSSSDSGLWS